MKDHLSAKDTKDFLKSRGILVHCIKKSDLSKIGGDFYLDREGYSDLKQRMDVEQNYVKSGRISFSKEHMGELEATLISLNNKLINQEDNTKLSVSKEGNGNTNIVLSYDEYKPSMIDLLDRTTRHIDITLNSNSDACSIDYNIHSPNDYKKVKELIAFITSNDDDIEYEFDEINLNKLTKPKRIELFERFFNSIKSPWELVEIKKLKVKRDEKEVKVAEDQLQGINSAVLDGDNLKENKFVTSTLDQGFYFSMASMRLDHISDPYFIDLVIDFKTRPEMCEVKIVNSGVYASKEHNEGLRELKSVMDGTEQDRLLLEFKNTLHGIFVELSGEELSEIKIIEPSE